MLQIQRHFVGLLGDPVHAKIAKEASTILKGITKDSPPPDYGRAARRKAPYAGRPRRRSVSDVLNEGMSPLLAAALQSAFSLVGVVPEIVSCRSSL